MRAARGLPAAIGPPATFALSTSAPMRARLAVPLLLAALVAGCDSAGIVLDSSFYIGSWTLASVSDDSGDRTDAVRAAVDDFDLRFDPDGSFVLDVDFKVAVNAAGQDDVRLPGDYQATPATLTLLLEEGVRLALGAEAESERRVRLTIPGTLVSLFLGSGVDFDGDVVLVIQRA